jgi:hypothetical protein
MMIAHVDDDYAEKRMLHMTKDGYGVGRLLGLLQSRVRH